MKKKVYLKIVLLFTLFSINTAISPKIIYYHYSVGGQIECESISDKSDYVVRLFGKSGDNISGEDYFPLEGMMMEPEHAVAISDSTGYFYIVVSHPHLLDSVKFGVQLSPGNIIYSDPVAIDESRLQEVTETRDNEGAGCSSCSVQPAKTVVVKYNYLIPGFGVNVCE